MGTLTRFRNARLQAAPDIYYIHQLLNVENKLKEGRKLWRELFVRPRNRRAAQSSFFVMFMQQFCGVSVTAYIESRQILYGDSPVVLEEAYHQTGCMRLRRRKGRRFSHFLLPRND
jgi:hypothetical protein